MATLPIEAAMPQYVSPVLTRLRPRIFFLLFVLALITTPSAVQAETLMVPAGGDLQAAINAAQPGDTIVVEAGATFIGTFFLPNKAGSSYITIQSSRLSELPEGVRVSPASAALMPKLLSPSDNNPVIRTEDYAHHWRLVGLEIAPQNDYTSDRLIDLLAPSGQSPTDMTKVPHHIIIDRCYVHSLPNNRAVVVGISLNSAFSEVTNSYVSEIHGSRTDSQAIFAYNGPGDLNITNNYLEAESECVLFGYGEAGGINPKNIQFRRNHVSRPIWWRHRYVNVKNLLEMKGGTNVIIEGNLFENNWAQGQNGNAVVFTAYGNEISNVQFINNIVRISGSGITISENRSTPLSHHITIRNNLFQHIAASAFGGEGVFLKIASVPHVVVDHNTIIHDGTIIQAFGDDPKSPDGRLKIKNFAYTNNIAAHNQYGIFSSAGYGNLTISAYFPGSTFARNVIAARWVDPSLYPGNNFYPSSLDGVGFINRGAGNYRLAANSGYKGRATDGKDIGCDFDALEAAMSGTSDLSASTQR